MHIKSTNTNQGLICRIGMGSMVCTPFEPIVLWWIGRACECLLHSARLRWLQRPILRIKSAACDSIRFTRVNASVE